MRRSRSSIDTRRGGFTLLEVIIAASLLAVVIGITLTQMGETTTATTAVTAQTDLRRIGNDILERIARDLRTTQSRYLTIETASANTVPKARIQFRKITGFDATAGDVTLESSGGTALIREYREAASPTSFNVRGQPQFNTLEFRRATAANLAAAPATILTYELARTGDVPDPGRPSETITSGFMVTTTSHSALTSLTTPLSTTSGTGCFPDEPVAIQLRVVMKRRIGARNATGGDLYAFATCQTIVELRPSKNYQ